MTDLAVVLFIILIIVLILRGPKTLPELGRMFGKGIREARIEASKLQSGDDNADGSAPGAGPGAPGAGPGPGSPTTPA